MAGRKRDGTSCWRDGKGRCNKTVIAPNLLFARVMNQALAEAPAGTALQFKTNMKLFDIRRFHKSFSLLVKDLQFADDAALLADGEIGLQQVIERLTRTVSGWGLTLSIPKTKIMCQHVPNSTPPPSPPVFLVGSDRLEVVERFQYLGSILSQSLTLDDEINHRITRAS